MSNLKPPILILTGPTATGKTLLGVRLAQKLNGEIVSADSMQIYKYMDIGTAKPTIGEMAGIPHHMIDIISPEENYSAAAYVKDAGNCIDNILVKNKLPIIVGGSGLYIDSLIRGRTFSPAVSPGLRRELEDKYDRLGGAAMLAELHTFDKAAAGKLHANDKKRIVRAFEIYLSTGHTISEHDALEKKNPDKYSAIIFALGFKDRAVLYNHIHRRADKMISDGLLNEVKSLLDIGISPKATSMQAIGYKELVPVLLQNAGLSEATEKIKTESTRYAKRQLTWLRRKSDIIHQLWDNAPDIDYGADRISRFFCEKAKCVI